MGIIKFKLFRAIGGNHGTLASMKRHELADMKKLNNWKKRNHIAMGVKNNKILMKQFRRRDLCF